MNFEEFFDKKFFVCYDAGVGIDVPVVVLSRKDLGEWALEQMLPWIDVMYVDTRRRYRFNFEAIQEMIRDNAGCDEIVREYDLIVVYWRIALGCLGKEEIKKRLKQEAEKK